jgi:transcriptional regulator with XRE-family HTH domain
MISSHVMSLAAEWTMEFPERLQHLRKQKGLTQKALADAVGMSLIQISRYESGQSQPTLDVLRRLAVALSVSADELLFDTEERGPDEELRLQFEAISRFDAEEKKVVKAVLDSLILKHEAKRWAAAS